MKPLFKKIQTNWKKYPRLSNTFLVLFGIAMLVLILNAVEAQVEFDTNIFKYKIIESIIDEAEKDAFNSNEKIIANIERQIKITYNGNLERLKQDLQNTTSANTLTRLCYKEVATVVLYDISDSTASDNNDPFMLIQFTNEKGKREWGVWIDNSKNCASYLGEIRTFEEEQSKHFNPILAQKAWNNIINQTSNFKIWSYLPVDESFPWYNEIKNLTYVDKVTLKNLYFKYKDIRVFASFEFLNAVNYIYDNSDLVGNKIILETGHINNNSYQIILVQGYNVVDIINNSPTYLKSLESYDELLMRTKATIRVIQLVSVILGVLIAVISGKEHNKEIIHERCLNYKTDITEAREDKQ